MAGESMQIRYTVSFADSLAEIIAYWQNTLKISDKTTQAFVSHINDKIILLKSFPEMGKDVTALYGFQQTTYRLTIGHSYAIFYRLTDRSIIVGAIHGTKQLQVKF